VLTKETRRRVIESLEDEVSGHLEGGHPHSVDCCCSACKTLEELKQEEERCTVAERTGPKPSDKTLIVKGLREGKFTTCRGTKERLHELIVYWAGFDTCPLCECRRLLGSAPRDEPRARHDMGG